MSGALRIADNEDGVSALNSLAQALLDAKESVNTAVDAAEGIIDENREGLGSYADKAESILADDVLGPMAQHIKPLEEVAGKLTSLAKSLQEYIDSNQGGGSGN